MIVRFQIGQIMHKPDGSSVYPVYFQKEYDVSTKTIYVTPEDSRLIVRELELILMKYNYDR
jgi:hypothetical protein